MARAADTHDRILRAAEDVVLRDGVAHLTLDNAASEAGLSKGGVLYHFPSRAALVSAMVKRLCESFDADLERYGAGSGARGAFTLAYLEASLAPGQPGEERQARLGSALFAGVASDPDLLAPLRERFTAWQAALDADGIDKELATVVRLAVDGMWFGDLFGFAPVEGKRLDALHRELRRLVQHGAGE
ncbi:MAG: TetR/AcrR family transcriptional regulator [Acidimicrobiales bacterium]